MDDLTVGGGHRARCDGLGRLVDLDEAHPAVARDAQAFVVAEARDFRARRFAGLQNGRASGHFDLDPVDGEFGHQVSRFAGRTPIANEAGISGLAGFGTSASARG